MKQPSSSLVWIGVAFIAPALAAAAGPAPGASKGDRMNTVRLAYQFRPGETVRWRVVHQATVQTTIQGTTQTARTRSESVKAWKVIRVTPAGNFELVHSVAWVKMINELPHRAQVEYDSRRDAQPPPGFATVARTVGVPLTVVAMTPQGKVLRREEKLRQPANQPDTPMTIPLPDQPIPVGHVWSREYTLSVPGKQGSRRRIKTRRRFELTSVRNGVAIITVDYQVLTPIHDPAIEAQLAQRLSHSTIRFDIAAGRILAQQTDVDKRVLGFSGPTSSIHHVVRRTERLLKPAASVARQSRPDVRRQNPSE